MMPPVPLEPKIAFVDFGEVPPELPPPALPEVGLQPEIPPLPPLIYVPTTPVTVAVATPPPTITPEPGSFVLMMTGTGALIGFARRRRSKA